MSNIGDHAAQRATFTWDQAQAVLGFPEGKFNLGWYMTDRICEMGKGEKTALIWESADGQTVRRYTFNELRLYANAYAKYLLEPGAEARRPLRGVHGAHPRAVHRHRRAG